MAKKIRIEMSEKIKVAYLDYSHIFAGAERVLYTIISNINTSKFEPILVFPYPMPHQQEYNSLDCRKIHLARRLEWWMGSDRWKHPVRGMDFLMRSILGCRLARFLHREHVDILHVNLLRPDSLMWILPAKKLGIKVIGHFRSQALSWIPPKWVQQNCNLILCVSKYSQGRLLTKGEYTLTQVLYDSINVETFSIAKSRSTSKKELGFPVDCLLISSIGQLSRHKGHDNAIKAFAKIALSYPKALLYIAGGGSKDDLMYLKDIVAEYPVLYNRVIFSEKQLSNIVEVYNASDIVLSLTKVGEAFGLVPYEAALMDVPFIAPMFGAITEFITDGKNGLLVDTNDVDAIAAKMEWAITHKTECSQMIGRAKSLVLNKLTPNVMINQLQEVYQDWVKK